MDGVVRYGGEEMSITISIGVSQTNKRMTTPEKLIRSADNTLQKAKTKGKNQVVSAGLSE